MSELSHRVRVFVYRMEQGSPSYLLLKSTQGIESFWTPLHGPIGFGVDLERAIRREVLDDVGITRASELVDLDMPSRWLVGDEEVIEWNFGLRSVPVENDDLRLDHARWEAFRWSGFGQAYPSLELEFDRAAIVRLHTLLGAA